MFTWRIGTIMYQRGVKSPLQFLRKRGLSYPRAWQLLNNSDKEIKLRQLEMLCFWLNCTPNDLLRWKPEGGIDGLDVGTAQPGHSLWLLQEERRPASLHESLCEMPYEQLKEFTRLLKAWEEERKKEPGP